MMDKEISHMYNLVQHIMIALANAADNQQNILQGNIPFHGKKQYEELIMSMLTKAQDIEQEE